jgi:hypothetical protein
MLRLHEFTDMQLQLATPSHEGYGRKFLQEEKALDYKSPLK